MRKFYEDSSQAKILSKDRSIHCALRYFSERPIYSYELRFYFINPYNGQMEHELLGIYVTKDEARVAKAFKEMQYGASLAICATQRYVSRSIDLEAVGG